MAPLLEKFRRDIAGILWLALAAFLAAALVSFHPTDPSFNSVSSGVSNHGVANLCGYFGSFLSDLLYQLLGAAAWVLVVGSLRLSIFAFKGKSTPLQAWRFLWGLLLVVIAASLCSLYMPQTKMFGGHIPLGGMVGALVSKGLVGVFNRVGVAIILWASVAVLIVFYTEKRLTELAPWLVIGLRKLWSGMDSLRQSLAASFKMPAPVEAAPGGISIRSHLPTEDAAEDSMKGSAARDQSDPVVEAPSKFSLNSVMNLAKAVPLSITKPARDEKKSGKIKASMIKTPRQVENWQLPPLDLLIDPPPSIRKIDEREITRNARLVEQKLAEFDVHGQVVEVKPGPAVTMYEFRPAASTKINDITKLADDLSLALSAESLRIIAPIPGRDVVGIETSNSRRDEIYMKDVVESQEFWSEDVKLPIALGKGVSGEAKVIDLRRIPHLLVAGTTGSGKSVFVMSLVTSLILRHSPKTLRLIIVDPKQVDMAAFHKIPHLLLPPVKEAKPAVNTLKWLIREMEKRYRSMSRFNSKNIESYNTAVGALKKDDLAGHEEKIRLLEENPQTAMQTYYCKPLPYIVAVIEEFSDLMSVDRAGVEPAVVRLAQMARASGIHLVIAMQSPRREVLTGLIKTNFPGRISFKVASKVDSSIVLDQRGAERLLSVGDMLYLAPGVAQPHRYHGAYLKDEEINAITDFWIKQGEPEFDTTAVNSAEHSGDDSGFGEDAMNPDQEEHYDEVVAFVSSQKEVSASLLQRRFRFGYPKAARLIEILEQEGVVGPANGSKPRQVLVNRLD